MVSPPVLNDIHRHDMNVKFVEKFYCVHQEVMLTCMYSKTQHQVYNNL